MPGADVKLEDIKQASLRIKDYITSTPLQLSPILSQETESDVYLKLECYQSVGVFKIRGALNKILSLPESKLKNGLITASSGNHGIAVAYGAKVTQSRASVVVPDNAIEEKVKHIISYGGNVIKHGKNYDDAYCRAMEIRDETGEVFVHPFDDPFVIAGQGTIGLETVLKVPDLDTLIVPIGGGGLISGISIAAKTLSSKIKIVGVQSEGAPATYNSWKAGKIIELDSIKTIADGLAARKPSDLTFRIIKNRVDDILLVSDREIGEAVMKLLKDTNILAEPSGAAPLAALLFKYNPKPNEKIALIVTGRNISLKYLAGLFKHA